MKHIAVFALATMTACSSQTAKPATDYSEFRVTLAAEDFKLRTKLGEIKKDFLHMTAEEYFSGIPKKLREQIESFPEHQFVTFPTGFVICVKSEIESVAICDNSNTQFVDRIKVIKPLPALDKLADEVRGP